MGFYKNFLQKETHGMARACMAPYRFHHPNGASIAYLMLQAKPVALRYVRSVLSRKEIQASLSIWVLSAAIKERVKMINHFSRAIFGLLYLLLFSYSRPFTISVTTG